MTCSLNDGMLLVFSEKHNWQPLKSRFKLFLKNEFKQIMKKMCSFAKI